MIDEIRIRGLKPWPEQAVDELEEIVRREAKDVSVSIARRPSAIEVVIISDAPNLTRENLKRGIAKSLDKVKHEHGLVADLESVEHVETEPIEFD